MENNKQGSRCKKESEDSEHFVLKIECVKAEPGSDEDEVSHISLVPQTTSLHALEKHVDKIGNKGSIKTEQNDAYTG